MFASWWRLTVSFASLWIAASDGFLFPDLQLRSGLFRRETSHTTKANNREIAAKYKIAVIQKEPYLFANNTGYVPDLLRHIALTMRQAGVEDFSYEILPVKSWHQLYAKAKLRSSLVSFGLVMPSLELTNWPFRHLDVSSPVLLSSLKLALKRDTINSQFGDDNDVTPNVRMTLIAPKGSPIEYLLLHTSDYNGQYYGSTTPEDAVTFLLESDNSVLVDDAPTVDYYSNRFPNIIQSLCPKRVAGSMVPFYGFFGRDKHLLNLINPALNVLHRDNTLTSLLNKYFISTENCS